MSAVREVLGAAVVGAGAVLWLGGLAEARADVPVEDDPGWSCATQGNRVCGPSNAEGVVAGCYSVDEPGVLVAPWPCHMVFDPSTGEVDVFLGVVR